MKKSTKIISGTLLLGGLLIPLASSVYGKTIDRKITMNEFMRIINTVYGVNLSGISSFKHSRVSIYAKERWILRHKKDLFIIHSGKDNKDIKIYPTEYFTEKTGLTVLPFELQEALLRLGMIGDEEDNSFYYRTSKEETISDIFLAQTLKKVTKVIQNSYSII